jgi:phosphoribosylformimino-5-aminoimidazole carboxamide ribotide isomerase
MDVLPSIDLREGEVVRLTRGDYSRQTTYSDDPAAVAQRFERAGARWIHVVDLDAARTGIPANTAAIRAIRQAVKASIQVGGGARNEEAIAALLGEGVGRVVVGSAALENWPWFERLIARGDLAGRLALALDAREGRLATRGWTHRLEATAPDVAARTSGSGLAAIVYTDISRDGTLAGVAVEATAGVMAVTDVPVIASGGVRSLDDVRACMRIGCAGVIIGKACYEGGIDLARACELAAGRHQERSSFGEKNV